MCAAGLFNSRRAAASGGIEWIPQLAELLKTVVKSRGKSGKPIKNLVTWKSM